MMEALDAHTDVSDELSKINPELLQSIQGQLQPLFDRPLVWPAGKSAAIAYVDGVFEEDFCNNIIELCLSRIDKSFPGKTMSGVRLETKVSTDWHLEQSPNLPQNKEQEYDKRIFKQLWRVLDLYKENIPQLRDPVNFGKCMTSDTGYQVQMYPKKSGFYSEHIDGAPWLDVASARTLGVVIYLNTVNIGGGTGFPMHDIVVDAVVGRVAIFPSNWTHPHCGVMPMSEDKWIISTFVNCTPTNGNHPGECGCPEIHGSDENEDNQR